MRAGVAFFYCSLLYSKHQAGLLNDHGNCLGSSHYSVVAAQHDRLSEPTQKSQDIWPL